MRTVTLLHGHQTLVDYESKNIGYFDTAVEAAKAYDEYAIKYFGEFACLNFPVEAEGGSQD